MTNLKTLIKNARVYTPDAVMDNGWVVVNSAGKIEQVGTGEANAVTFNQTLDAEGAVLLPGLSTCISMAVTAIASWTVHIRPCQGLVPSMQSMAPPRF